MDRENKVGRAASQAAALKQRCPDFRPGTAVTPGPPAAVPPWKPAAEPGLSSRPHSSQRVETQSAEIACVLAQLRSSSSSGICSLFLFCFVM